MNILKLLTNPLPIDRLARKVVAKAKPENVWMPSVYVDENTKHSRNGLAIKRIPSNADHTLLGRRRDRLTIIGYAADQPAGKHKPARWVVRCDCGNYEHRSSILRWLGTDAPDMCLECRKRTYITKGEYSPREPAKRATKEAM